MTEKWYDCTPEALCEKLSTNISGGLSKKAALLRLKKHGGNDIFPIPRTSFFIYLKAMLIDITSILLIITAVIAMIFDQKISAAVVIALLFINLGIAVFTYVKAQRILENTGLSKLPPAKVMREGRICFLKQDQLVPGDVIFVGTGDIVPADARLAESEDLTVLESGLSGMARPVQKDEHFVESREIPPEKQKNMLFASTVIASGSGRAIVCRTGEDTLIAGLKKNRPLITHEQLAVLKLLKKYCSVWSMCMITVIFLFTVLNLLIGLPARGIFDVFMTGLTLAVAAMSEFYAAFGYIIVGCGIFNANHQLKDATGGALIVNTSALNTLKDLTCLVVPRESMFSVKNSYIQRVYANGQFFGVDEFNFAENSLQTLKYAVISTGIYGSKKLISNNMSNQNIYSAEEDAIIALADKLGLYNAQLEQRYPILEHRSVSNMNRFETTLAATGPSGSNLVIVRGDAQLILNCCSYYTEHQRVSHISPEKLNDLRIIASQMAKEALRVVAVASKTTDHMNLSRIYSCQSNLVLEGFLVIREPLLNNAVQNIAKCREAGVKVILTCADVTSHNQYNAEMLGIVEKAEETVTSRQLAEMKDDLFRTNISVYRMYQGLSLPQKSKLLQYLRDSGERVGLLTDSLDELDLMRNADICFTQNFDAFAKNSAYASPANAAALYHHTSVKGGVKSGCDALRFLADVIVSMPNKTGSGGFNAVLWSVCCAKVIYQNILRIVRYLLASQTARLLILFYSILSGVNVLNPVQLLFCGLAVDFMSVLIIAFERPSRNILKTRSDTEKYLRKPMWHNPEAVIFGIIWGGAACASILVTQLILKRTDGAQIGFAVFAGYILTQLVTLLEIKKEESIFKNTVIFNRIYGLFLIGLTVFFSVCLLNSEAGRLFGILPLSLPYLLSALSVPFFMMIFYEIYKLITKNENFKFKHTEKVKHRRKKSKEHTAKADGAKSGKFSLFSMSSVFSEEILENTAELDAIKNAAKGKETKPESSDDMPSYTGKVSFDDIFSDTLRSISISELNALIEKAAEPDTDGKDSDSGTNQKDAPSEKNGDAGAL